MTIYRAASPAIALALSIFIMAISVDVSALPMFGEAASLVQPDGSEIMVQVWGDEYHQRLEDMAGYTMVRDPDGWICFARLDVSGEELESTGVRAGSLPPAGIEPGIRLPGDIVQQRVIEAQQVAGRIPREGDKADYPVPATEGAVRGILILADFPDEHAVMDPAIIEAAFNEIGFSGFGNNGSVRDYYRDISAGRLDLTHEVPDHYYRAAHPKSYYEDPGQSQGWRARQLVTEGLQDLERHGFDFSQYDANGDGYVDLVTCLYAGSPALGHGVGLWPQAGEAGYQVDGVTARLWNINPIRDEFFIGTACHEIGHALCQWPDLYDTGFESWGAGLFCLMSNPGSTRNPTEPCGPLKYRSGWTHDILLDGVMPDLEARAGENQVFVLPHPIVSNELYIVENRQRFGRDASIPDDGLAVWHVDWRGSNNREAMQPDIHYMVTLVQADGRWDLEHDANWGDDTDLFGGEGYDRFAPDTSPSARWWRGLAADLHLEDIGEPGPVMEFSFRDGVGRWPLELIVEPVDLDAPWQITGADGYIKFGAGGRTAHVPDEGSYVVTWRHVPGWQAPPSEAVWVPEAGPAPEVTGMYSHPPFASTAVPALANPAPGRGGQIVDFDSDGDLDLFLCRDGESDNLLRNDGGWQFTDVTPPVLAQPAATVAAAWADIDADGDQDVYLVRRGAAGLLLRQTAPGFFASDAEFTIVTLDSVRGATWLDHDHDGKLDLHLVREGESDLLLRSPNKAGPVLAEYEIRDILPGHSFARTVTGTWCDFDRDGRPDLYMVNNFGSNVLAHNRLPVQFADVTHGGLGVPYRGGAAAWGDHDGDGDFDLYIAHDGGSDVLLTQYEGTFVMESEENTDTPGAGRDATWADFDNDGDLDLFIARYGQSDRLLMNEGEDLWRESPLMLAGLDGPTVAVIAGDLDADGGVDLVLDRDGMPPLVLRNSMNRGHWLQVDARGFAGLRDPVGAILTLHLGDRVVLRQIDARSGPSGNARRVHFGLGAATVADSLVINWPDGETQIVRDIAADQILEVVEPASGGTGSEEVPVVTNLMPAWPNPFNPGTNLAFDLASNGPARLVIYDVKGRRVRTIHDGDLPAGRHPFRWDGRDNGGRGVAAGVYVARLEAGGMTFNTRLAFVK